jgi:hypothetical protein
MMISQSPARVMLVKPAVFTFNPQTSTTNVFQSKVQLSAEQTYARAMQELEDVYHMYRAHDISVEVFASGDRETPDAIFPNCVSTFPGHVFGQSKPVAVLHPMLEPNRRAERSPAFVQFFKDLGYDVVDDLLSYEEKGLALEGTGSVVMDHVNKVAYCALSPRSHLKVAETFADLISYRLQPFNTIGTKGEPVYHTDLVMNIGTDYAQVSTPVIKPEDQGRIVNSLRDTGRDVMELNRRQFGAFCGNSLEVRNVRNEKFFSTSTRAYKALSSAERERIESHVSKIIHAKVRMIERVGGGSDRCLTQELHGLDADPEPVNRFENVLITVPK